MYGEFEGAMQQLCGKDVWVSIYTKVINTCVRYPEFEFIHFKNGKYKLGHKSTDEEHELGYEDIIIKKDGIVAIYKDEFAPTLDAEDITLTMCDGSNIFVRCNI
jgi:hypothetical protein